MLNLNNIEKQVVYQAIQSQLKLLCDTRDFFHLEEVEGNKIHDLIKALESAAEKFKDC